VKTCSAAIARFWDVIRCRIVVQLLGGGALDFCVVARGECADVLHWHAREQLVHDEGGELLARQAKADKHAGGRVRHQRRLLRANASEQRHRMAVIFEADELLEVREHSNVGIPPPNAANRSLSTISLC
jgi:hypothetical protein